MYERVFVEWTWNFVAELLDGVVISSSFITTNLDSEIRSKTAERLEEKLSRYFKGKPVDFSEFKVRYPSLFAERVLENVRRIQYGKVLTYSELARNLSTSPRAVGVALKNNPALVVVPCHRVVSKGGIGGYSEGVEIKRELLKLEKAVFQTK